MAIILKKPGQTPAKLTPPKVPIPVDDADYKSPFKESCHQEGVSASPAAHVAPVAPVPVPPAKPKAIFKIMGGRPVRPGLPPASPAPVKQASASELVDAGLEEEKEPTSQELYPLMYPGEFVVITNDAFPWVKHYKPGDIARILYSSITHSHPDDLFKYRNYVMEILDGPRKGQKAMLFRYEFEPRKTALPMPKIEGRMITQT